MTRLAVLLATLCAVLLSPASAWALRKSAGTGRYCHATTCSCKNPEDCAATCGLDSNGCKTKGEPLRWGGACMGYALSLRGTASLTLDDIRTALQRAFDAWASVDCGGGKRPSIEATELRDVVCAKTDYQASGPNVNVVFFRDTGWAYKTLDDTLALTTLHFDKGTGEVRDADIAMNSAINDFTVSDVRVGTDLQSVLTHEVGHFFGLDHSSDPAATMFSTYQPGTMEIRQLSTDDRDAICDAYPPERAAVCSVKPLGGLAGNCTDSKPWGCTASPALLGEGRGVALAFGASLAFVILIVLRRAYRRSVVAAKGGVWQ